MDSRGGVLEIEVALLRSDFTSHSCTQEGSRLVKIVVAWFMQREAGYRSHSMPCWPTSHVPGKRHWIDRRPITRVARPSLTYVPPDIFHYSPIAFRITYQLIGSIMMHQDIS